MKRVSILFLFVLLSITGCKTTQNVVEPNQSHELSVFEKLASIKQVVSIEKKELVSHFDEHYEIHFEQPVDHNDLTKGTFKQRVLLGFEKASSPVIVELQGYGIYTAKAGELAQHFEANQLTIEHRYFKNSRPKEIEWETLTIENAAKDQAIIIDEIRKAIFTKSKFITTGISKGCQATMAHRRFFPDNVDASVCYVGPLNYKREDPRIYKFLKTVGSQDAREKVKAFQELCFQNRDLLLKIMKKEAIEKNLSWEFGVEKAIDYSILEYAFAFWQWGNSLESIPNKGTDVNEIYRHLIKVAGYGFFEEKAVDDLQPYFWAALTEQGIYGYETAPFKKYLNTDKVYKFDWAFPEDISATYDIKPMQDVKRFLDTSAKKMLFIYGEYDAWSATAVELDKGADKRQLYKFIKPKGDHTTRIKNFDPKKQDTIYDIIGKWLE